MVKPSDVYVLTGLLAQVDGWTYRSLAGSLRVAHPVVQRALSRSGEAGLYVPERREVNLPSFEEFAVHALRFVAPERLGTVVPGVPAAWATEPVSSAIRTAGEDLPPVWPYARGRVRGQALEPLHPAAVRAVEGRPRLGEYLSVLDSLRAGDTRVRQVSAELLGRMLRERLAGGRE